MVPLFALLDRSRVSRVLSDPRISARPAFHWRLQNAGSGSPESSVTGQWDRWRRIEAASLDAAGLASRLASRTLAAVAPKQRSAALM